MVFAEYIVRIVCGVLDASQKTGSLLEAGGARLGIWVWVRSG